jgi:hypothetical protein
LIKNIKTRGISFTRIRSGRHATATPNDFKSRLDPCCFLQTVRAIFLIQVRHYDILSLFLVQLNQAIIQNPEFKQNRNQNSQFWKHHKKEALTRPRIDSTTPNAPSNDNGLGKIHS